MVDLAIKYFNECHLQRFADEIKGLVETGQLIEAQNLASSFSPISTESNNWLELSDPSIITTIEQAFTKTTESLITYPRALGEFWNDQLTRGSFVAFLAPEKRGKSFWMLDMAIRGCRQGQRIAFFQAGDMTEDEQLIRIASYLSKQPMQSAADNKILIPIRDCCKNQIDCCDDDNREETVPLFNAKATNINNRETITFDECLEKLKIPGYSTCTNCKAFKENKWGTVWYKEIEKESLTIESAKKVFTEFFIKYKRKFKISTHVNGTLTVNNIKSILDIWQKQEDFIPDIIVIDYADLLEDSTVKEFRHKSNQIWKDLRVLSQERHCFLITATQADADSYARNLLKLDNFSEDKRKYAHVTAMWGLNWDKDGREKKLGIMRINEIIKRKGNFNNHNQVYVLQNLQISRPFLTSFW